MLRTVIFSLVVSAITFISAFTWAEYDEMAYVGDVKLHPAGCAGAYHDGDVPVGCDELGELPGDVILVIISDPGPDEDEEKDTYVPTFASM